MTFLQVLLESSLVLNVKDYTGVRHQLPTAPSQHKEIVQISY